MTNQNSGGANEALKQPISNEYQHSLQLIESSEEGISFFLIPDRLFFKTESKEHIYLNFFEILLNWDYKNCIILFLLLL